MEADKKLGRRIRILREIQGFTAEQAADGMGISLSKYQDIENGMCNISLSVLEKVSSVLGVKISSITSVLDWDTTNSLDSKDGSVRGIFDMIDLFYANKYLTERIMANG